MKPLFDNPAFRVASHDQEPLMQHTISLAPGLHDRLVSTAKELHKPVTEIARLAIARFLDELDNEK